MLHTWSAARSIASWLMLVEDLKEAIRSSMSMDAMRGDELSAVVVVWGEMR